MYERGLEMDEWLFSEDEREMRRREISCLVSEEFPIMVYKFVSNLSPSIHRPPWHRSLAFRLGAVWALLFGVAVGISSWISHRDAREQLLGNLQQSIEQDSSVIQLRLATWMRALQEDTRATSQSPLLAAFLKARHTQEDGFWRPLLEDEFRAVFAGTPDYFQMRVLEVGGGRDGEETLRLDRLNERLVVTPEERLQKKAGRSYYQEALALPDQLIYLSDINLNQDFGGVTLPHIPTIRSAAKISAAVPVGG